MEPMSATPTTSRLPTSRHRPRTVDGTPPPRPVAPRRGFSGIVAALQALVLSLAVVVLPGVVAFLASSSGAGEGTGWGRSVTVAVSLWLLGHGVPLVAGGATVTLVPLGLTALALFTCFASARRSAHTAVSAWVAGTVTYALAVFGIALLTGATTTWGLAVALLGGALVGALGIGGGILARPDAPLVADLVPAASRLLPLAVRVGARGGVVGVSLLVGVSSLVFAVWAIAGRATSADIVTGLAPGIVGGIVLALAQLTLVPNLVAWSASWLIGPGFAVGEGTHFTAAGSEPGVLPSVPLLGALPGDGWTNGATAWAPALVVVLGVVAGVFVWRRLPDDAGSPRWSDLALAVLALAGTAGVLLGVLVAVASGAVGSGGLSTVGADGLRTGLLAAAEIGGGACVALAWCRGDVVRRLRTVGGRGADGETVDGETVGGRGPDGETVDVAE